MMLQAQSVEKFLEPCTHWVIVNDTPDILEKTKDIWLKFLPKYYKNHNLKLIFPEWTTALYCGWERQQVLKFQIYKQIQDDYLLLDSKNFFIKKCSTEHWRNVYGCGYLQDYKKEGKWFPTSEFYASRLKEQVINIGYSLQTPFVFHKETLDKLGDIDKFCEDWIKDHHKNQIMPSEFLYYTYLEKEKLQNYQQRSYHYTVWPNVPETDEEITNLFNSKNCLVWGMHRHAGGDSPENKRDFLKQLIKNIGITMPIA